MGSLLGFATIVLLGSHAVLALQNMRVSTAFKNSGIVPDIIPVAPRDMLDVYYGTSGVCLGNEIPHTHTALMPILDYNFRPNVNYTLLFIDPDAPASATPAYRSSTNWIVVNIPGGNIEAGRSIASYIPVVFYPGSGYRRFVFLLYAQNRTIDVSDRDLLRLGVYRIRFSVADFVSQYGLGELVAGNFFVSSLESSERYCRA